MSATGAGNEEDGELARDAKRQRQWRTFGGLVARASIGYVSSLPSQAIAVVRAFLGGRRRPPQPAARHRIEAPPAAREEEEESDGEESDDEEEPSSEEEVAEDLGSAMEACRRHSQALEAANAAERALLFEIAREGAAERSASLARERERAAEACSRAAASRIDPVRSAESAWSRMGQLLKGNYLEIREQGSSWIVRVLDVAAPEADARSRGGGGGHRSALSSSRRDGGGFVGAVCVEPLLDPHRLPLRAECIGGAAFERLFPRHHSWPFAPWDRRQPASTCRLMSLDRLASARFLEDDDEIQQIDRDVSERLVVVHYILDNDEACPVKVEPSDLPISQYQIDYEIPRRRNHRLRRTEFNSNGLPSSFPLPGLPPRLLSGGSNGATGAVGRASSTRGDLASMMPSPPSALLDDDDDDDDDDDAHFWPRGGGGANRSSNNRQKTKLRVRHGPTGARIRCRSRRANALSLDPVELYTAPLANGRGLNVLHIHLNSFGDDASVEVVDLRSMQEYADALSNGASADDATICAVEATKRRDDLFKVDVSGRALDYAILADGKRVVTVLVADDDSACEEDEDEDDLLLASILGRDGMPSPSPPPISRSERRPIEARFVEHRCPRPGDVVSLPDGALGILRGPLPLGLLIREDPETALEEEKQNHRTTSDSSTRLQDRRCRNCGNKCPEALPGIVDVDVVSIMAPTEKFDDDPQTLDVDSEALAAVVEMGFEEQRARIALAATKASQENGVAVASADAAVQWLLQRPDGDDASAMASLTRESTKIVMVPKILDNCRPISYPVCVLSKPSPETLAEHEARVKAKDATSADAAENYLQQLEKLLFDQGDGRDKKAALREARKLKALVDDAVAEERLVVDELRQRNIDRELRLLAFG